MKTPLLIFIGFMVLILSYLFLKKSPVIASVESEFEKLIGGQETAVPGTTVGGTPIAVTSQVTIPVSSAQSKVISSTLQSVVSANPMSIISNALSVLNGPTSLGVDVGTTTGNLTSGNFGNFGNLSI